MYSNIIVKTYSVTSVLVAKLLRVMMLLPWMRPFGVSTTFKSHVQQPKTWVTLMNQTKTVILLGKYAKGKESIVKKFIVR